MKQTQRHKEIVSLLKEKSFLSTDALVATLSVSPQTIRRDLNYLAQKGVLHRHHGGASLESSTENKDYNMRKTQASEEKARIAEMIATQIPDGSSLFIDIGTSTEAVAQALMRHTNLCIVTNNLNVAAALTKKEDFTVIIAGGEIRHKDGGIVGEATRDFIQQFRMDFAIISVSGITEEGALLDFDYHEVKVAQTMMYCARQVYLTADYSKFGRNAMVCLGSIDQVHALFTDRVPPEKLRQHMQEKDVSCYIC